MRRKLSALLVVTALLTTIVGGALAQSLPGTGWYTVFQVANVSGTNSGNLTMEAYVNTDGNVAQDLTSATFAFDANRPALIFNPGLAPNYGSGGSRIGFSADLASGFNGSAVLSSDTDVRAVLQIGNNPNGSVGVTGGRASAFSQGIGQEGVAPTIFFPVAKNDFSAQTTSFSVQAVGADAVTTITYAYGNPVVTKTQTKTIKANRQFIFAPTAAGVPANTLGSATVTTTSAGASLAGTSVEYATVGIPAVFSLSTRSFTALDASTTIYAPAWKKAFAGGTAGISIQNTDATAATVDVEFTVTNLAAGVAGLAIGDKFRVDNLAIGAGASKTVSGININTLSPTKGGVAFTVPDGVFASVKVTSDGSQKLVGVINETSTIGKAAYQAFGAGDTSLSLPLVKEMFPAANPNTTSVVVQNVGAMATNITITYANISGTRAFTFSGVQPGQAVNAFKCSVAPGTTGNCSQFTGNAPQGGQNYAVTISSTASTIVALAQESDQRAVASNLKIDVKNYESFSIGLGQ